MKIYLHDSQKPKSKRQRIKCFWRYFSANIKASGLKSAWRDACRGRVRLQSMPWKIGKGLQGDG